MSKMIIFTCLLMALTAAVSGQTKQVTGQVVDSVDNPIPGASVNVKGETKGTSADSYGNFKLTVPQGATTILVSAIGHIAQEVDVTNSSTVKIQLSSSNTKELEEVVVTSLGIKREKRTLTYSTQEIKADALVTSKQDNVINDLAGKVSGVQITNSSGMPGSSARIVIRGAVSLIGQNQPLFIVDGVPVNNDEAGAIDAFAQGSDNVSLNQGSTSNRAIDIDPNIIESVNVLKGAAATALYGSAAATGAIIITTKNGGRASKPQISVSSSYAMADPIFYPFQNKWAQGSEGVFIDGNGADKTSASWGPSIDSLISAGVDVKRYNQQKLFFRTGHTSDNNISVSGGTDKSRYLVSYSFLKTDGIMRNTDFTRHS
ncbi:MAG: TonB-dependent receptor plug domain-containing protein, partial [Flavitalea sp.]